MKHMDGQDDPVMKAMMLQCEEMHSDKETDAHHQHHDNDEHDHEETSSQHHQHQNAHSEQ